MKNVEKYVKRHAEIIYMDAKGNFTQREIFIYSVQEDKVQAFCTASGAPRTLLKSSILAMQPPKCPKGISPFIHDII
ncbi:hypothetical protein [Paenibacillus gansuensis]|uniref:WYL domain-containing protein n=1 Tax=Paenibacillus gansuensis TaxID=306542 RepID=A0ABW5PDQ3_9BACL